MAGLLSILITHSHVLSHNNKVANLKALFFMALIFRQSNLIYSIDRLNIGLISAQLQMLKTMNIRFVFK